MADSIKEINERFWLEMTKRGTLPYCHEMLKLSLEFQSKRSADMPYGEYLNTLDEDILNYMDFINRFNKRGKFDEITSSDSPFPTDLHGYIHEYGSQSHKFQPNHLMCKLAVLRDDINNLHYEFLIEYDIFETDVEIYFGVKAISDSWLTTPEFQRAVLEDWKKVEKLGCYKTNKHRFKITNNGNNGTFWPFWWRMGMDCKEELADAIQIIKKFYRDYKRFLTLKDVFKPRFERLAMEVANSLLREDDYENLINKIILEYNVEIAENFKILLQKCIENELIKKSDNESVLYYCIGPSVKMVCLIRGFFQRASFSKKELVEKHTPIEALSRVILDKNGRVINTSNWRKDPDQMWDRWMQALDTLEGWFPNT